jgi:hypothetical protein
MPIENRSEEDLEIARFTSSCGCIVQIQPSTFRIARGQNAAVRLALFLQTPDSQQSEDVRNFEMRLTPIIDKPGYNHPGWIVSGKVRKAVRLSSRNILFWKDIIRGQASPVETVKVTSSVLLKNIAAKYDPSALTVHIRRLTVHIRRAEEKASRVFYIEVEPGPDLPAGQFAQEFEIEPILDSGERLPASIIRAAGVICDSVQVTPSFLDLGAQPLGTSKKETVILRSVTNKPFSVEKIDNGKDVIVTLAHSTHSEHWFELSQHVTGEGAQVGEIRFLVREPEGRSIAVLLKIKYYGTNQSVGSFGKLSR